MTRSVIGDGNTDMILLSSLRAHCQHINTSTQDRHHSHIHSFTHSFIEQTVEGSMIWHCAGHWMWCVLELTPMMTWGSRVGRGGEGDGHWIEPWAWGWQRWEEGTSIGTESGRGAGQSPGDWRTNQRGLWCSWGTGTCPPCDREYSRPGVLWL